VAQTSEVDAALAVLRAMVAIADTTVEDRTGGLTLTQFRALREVAERTPVTMSAVAQTLAINPSSVTRACEKLVTVELLTRAQNPLNRREILLAPTALGRRLLEQVAHDRRAALARILDRLDEDTRARVTAAFELFAAATEPADRNPVTRLRDANGPSHAPR
jgi:DNA-binding MarR family transcriptional regulator